MDRLREWGEKHNIVDESDVKKEDYWLDLDIQVGILLSSLSGIDEVVISSCLVPSFPEEV